MYEEDVKNKFITWLKRYVNMVWVKAGVYIGDWGILPNYNPSHNQKRLTFVCKACIVF